MNGQTLTCGRRGDGPSTAIIEKALQHLKNWTCLARAVCQAEFPDFDIINCFAAFRVTDTEKKSGVAAVQRSAKNDPVEKLAVFFGHSVEDAKEQWTLLRKVAVNKYCSRATKQIQ